MIGHGLHGERGGAYADHRARPLARVSRSTSWRSIFVVMGGDRKTGSGPPVPGPGRRYPASSSPWCDRHPGVPLFLLGHSNGGQVVLRLALEEWNRVGGSRAQIHQSDAAMPVPPGKLKIGKVLLSSPPGSRCEPVRPLAMDDA